MKPCLCVLLLVNSSVANAAVQIELLIALRGAWGQPVGGQPIVTGKIEVTEMFLVHGAS